MKDDLFISFLTKGHFNLIIGIDEVTNVRALTALQDTSNELNGLTVKAFYNDQQPAIFHPKLCWFRQKRKGVLIVGSGNLTAKGLRGNWEAFTISELNPSEADALECQWTRWVEMHSGRLKSLDDQSVIDRAAQNVWIRRRRRPTTVTEEESEAAEVILSVEDRLFRVLVAEIPRASDRWNQANFDLDNFRNYFGQSCP